MSHGQIKSPNIIPLRLPIPGKTQNQIDNQTLVELSSDTENTLVYFTINGNKPDPTAYHSRTTPKDKIGTYLYTKPFALPPGKRTVKAVAVTDDNRESYIISKTFEVESVAAKDAETKPLDMVRTLYDDDIYQFQQQTNDRPKKQTTPSQKPKDFGQSRFTKRNSEKKSSNHQQHDDEAQIQLNNKSKKQESTRKKEWNADANFESVALKKETNLFQCIYCLQPRPVDPFARFCDHCGNQMPTLPKSSAGTIASTSASINLDRCPHCNSAVPTNTARCIVCEYPLQRQQQQQHSHSAGATQTPSTAADLYQYRQKRVCSHCGTVNPDHVERCLLCETKFSRDDRTVTMAELNFSAMKNGGGAAPDKKKCEKCAGQLDEKAKFCDACGHSQHVADPVRLDLMKCARCNSANKVYSKFCERCGQGLGDPLKTGAQRHAADSMNTSAISIPLTEAFNRVFSSPGGLEKSTALYKDLLTLGADGPPPSTATAATQTVGLLYPSAAELSKNAHKLQPGAEQPSARKPGHDKNDLFQYRDSLLTVISPGKGYWRKQLDHIIYHFKHHLAHDEAFRKSLEKHKMARLQFVDVIENQNELNVSLRFDLKGGIGSVQNAGLRRSRLSRDDTAELLAWTSSDRDKYRDEQEFDEENGEFTDDKNSEDELTLNSEHSEADSFENETESKSNHSKKNKYRKRHDKTKKKHNKKSKDLSAQIDENDLPGTLAKEVGPEGKGREAMINALVQRQVNVNHQVLGIPVLIMAIRNRHFRAAFALINAGANVNCQEAEHENGALHEAALLGTATDLELIKLLFKFGANPMTRNSNNETPQELAVKSNFDRLARLFAERLGQIDSVENVQLSE